MSLPPQFYAVVSTRWGGADDDVRVSQFYYDYSGLRAASIEAENVEKGPGYNAASQTFVNNLENIISTNSHLRDVGANATICVYNMRSIGSIPSPDVLQNATYDSRVDFAYQSCDQWSTANGQLYWYVAYKKDPNGYVEPRFVGLATADGHMQSTFLHFDYLYTPLSEQPFARPSDQALPCQPASESAMSPRSFLDVWTDFSVGASYFCRHILLNVTGRGGAHRNIFKTDVRPCPSQ